MAQLSRPYQVALVAVGFLALVWFVALRPHGSTSGSSASATQQSAQASGQAAQSAGGASSSTAAEEAKKAAQPTPVYHGSAPGLKGLSSDVRKAHEAVGDSQSQARSFEDASAEPGKSGGTAKPAQSGGTAAPSTQGATGKGATSTTHGAATTGASAKAKSDPAAATRSTKVDASRTASRTGSGHQGRVHLSKAAAIGAQLKHGKVVLLLFWNPHSSDDAAVHGQLKAVSRKMGGKVALHFARAREVGSFGTVTRNVGIYQTPTLLVIGKHGLVRTITGLTDAFSIEQAVREAGS